MISVLGLIPARGGSKSVPYKNIAPLAGKPLLHYTCRAALESRTLTRVVLSTDDERIAAVGRDCGVEVPFLRPAELAGDRTPSVAVARHALEWLIQEDNWRAELLVLLQPTSPLRRREHIDAAVTMLQESGADTVVSVVEVPHRFSPYSIMRLDEGRLTDFWQDPLPFDRYHRQSQPVLYARNGPAVLVSRTATILERGSFYGSSVRPYLMSETDSVDIDTPEDLHLAAWYLGRGKKGS